MLHSTRGSRARNHEILSKLKIREKRVRKLENSLRLKQGHVDSNCHDYTFRTVVGRYSRFVPGGAKFRETDRSGTGEIGVKIV